MCEDCGAAAGLHNVFVAKNGFKIRVRIYVGLDLRLVILKLLVVHSLRGILTEFESAGGYHSQIVTSTNFSTIFRSSWGLNLLGAGKNISTVNSSGSSGESWHCSATGRKRN